MADLLRIEELEERIAPTVIAAGGSLTFTDGDGDQVRVSYFGPAGSQADVTDAGGGNIDPGDSIGLISVSDSAYTSVLLVENLGGGDGRTDILDGVQSATAGADFGVIALGVGADGSGAGEVDLAAGAQVVVDGNLGMLVVNGDVDFEGAGGHTISAAGDIGLVEVRGDMALDPTNGARIYAGGGAGDISFIRVGGLITMGGPELPTVDVGAGYTVDDDAGSGTSGSLTVKVSGIGATGQLTLIPIADGGKVLSRLEVSDGASITVKAIGDGGDVTEVSSAGAVGSLIISGAGDTDLYSLSASNIGQVINYSVGGDIASVYSTGGIGKIQTLKLGSLGSVFTGAGNSYPLVVAGYLSETNGTQATGAISAITVGGVVNTSITVLETSGGADDASIVSLVATPGGISGTDIDVDGSVGTVRAAVIEGSDIYAETGIALVKVGAAGIKGASVIGSPGGIGAVITGGPIIDSLITAKYTEGSGLVYGAGIGTVRAGSAFASQLSAFSGFGLVKINGALVDSSVVARFNDTFLGTSVGGSIGSFIAGGVYLDSSVVAFGDISFASIGAGGVIQNSVIDATGTLVKLLVRGDVADDSIVAATAGIGTASIKGALAFDGRISSSGGIGLLSIGGGIIGGDVVVAGNVNRFVTRGGISGLGVSIGVGGSIGSFAVSGGILGAGVAVMDVGGDVGSFSVRGGIAKLLPLTIGGNVGTFRAAAGGTVYGSTIAIDGDVNAAWLKGSGTTFTVGGDLGSLRLLSDAVGFTGSVGGATGSVTVLGASSNLSRLNFYGNVGALNINGDVNNSLITIGEDGSPAGVGSLRFGGNTANSTVDVWGTTGAFSVRGSIVYTGVNLRGNVAQISVGGGIYGTYMRVHGSAALLKANSSVHDSETLFDDGVAEYRVGGSIYNVNVGNEDSDSHTALGAGAIGKLTAADINGANISAYGGIGDVAVRGTIYGATIQALGDAGSGASIGRISAKGLVSTQVTAYNAIGSLVLGDQGIGSGTTITATNGDLGSITTVGLVYGDISVGGDLVGSINSAGATAIDLGTGVDLYFCDANGTITGGTLTVTGNIGGVVS